VASRDWTDYFHRAVLSFRALLSDHKYTGELRDNKHHAFVSLTFFAFFCMGLLPQIKDMVKSQDDYNSSLLDLSVASKNAVMFNAAMACLGHHSSLQEVKNAITEN